MKEASRTSNHQSRDLPVCLFAFLLIFLGFSCYVQSIYLHTSPPVCPQPLTTTPRKGFLSEHTFILEWAFVFLICFFACQVLIEGSSCGALVWCFPALFVASIQAFQNLTLMDPPKCSCCIADSIIADDTDDERRRHAKSRLCFDSIQCIESIGPTTITPAHPNCPVTPPTRSTPPPTGAIGATGLHCAALLRRPIADQPRSSSPTSSHHHRRPHARHRPTHRVCIDAGCWTRLGSSSGTAWCCGRGRSRPSRASSWGAAS